MTVVQVEPPLPTGTEIRRWTRRSGRRNVAAGFTDVFGDLYMVGVAVLMTSATVFSLAGRLAPGDAVAAPDTAAGPWLDAGWLALLAALAAIGALVGVATRLGPLAVSSAESVWWLSLSVERRTLLRAAAWRWPGGGALIGAVTGAAVGLASGAAPSGVVVAAVTGGALTASAIELAGLAQPRPDVHRMIRRIADLMVMATPALGVLVALAARPAPRVSGGLAVAAVAFSALAAGLMVRWDARLDRVPGVSLRSQGASADEALVAVLSLDPRGLGRALSARSEPAQRRARWLLRSVPWVTRRPRWGRVVLVVVLAEWALFVRTRRYPAQLAVAACLPALPLLTPTPRTSVVVAATMGGAYLAALATVDGIRRAQLVPALNTMLPLGEAGLRLARLVVPAAVMAFWAPGVMALLAWRFGDLAGHLSLGLLAAPMWAAAAARGASRPIPDFSGPLIMTPMGAIPPGLSAVVAQGPDLAVAGSIPVITAIVTGHVTPSMLGLQAVFTAVALYVAVRYPRPDPQTSR